MRKKVLILGSTGSIGRATLEVIEKQNNTFEVFGLACRDNVELLNLQIKKFKPQYVCVYDTSARDGVSFNKSHLFTGIEGMKTMIAMNVDIIVNALPGSIGLEPTIEALQNNKVLALANKESLVMAGRIISQLTKKNLSMLIPVDSEHSALFQLLKCIERKELKSILITASGGPFRDLTIEELEHVTPEEALNHPTWKMGQKVTLDSATLMNKGLEVIEARWLFDIEPSHIRVIIHPESILHGIVELVDGSFMSYMAYPDMKIPISYALNEKERHPLPFATMDLEKLHKLTFYTPDVARFPSLKLAYDALKEGDSATVTMNASNEIVSEAFIEGKIRFTDMPALIEKTLEHQPGLPVIEDIETVWDVHRWAQGYTEQILRKHYA